MKKEEMLRVLAEIATKTEVELDYNVNDFEGNFNLLTLCDGISPYEVNMLYGRTDIHISDIVDNTYSEAKDNDVIQVIFRITRIKDNDVGYIRFKGRYSSWDCLSYYTSEAVYPRKIEQIVYDSMVDCNGN